MAKRSRIRQGTLERLVGLLLHRVEDERDAERQQRGRQHEARADERRKARHPNKFSLMRLCQAGNRRR